MGEEEKNDEQKDIESQPTGAPVMDIQPPKPADQPESDDSEPSEDTAPEQSVEDNVDSNVADAPEPAATDETPEEAPAFDSSEANDESSDNSVSDKNPMAIAPAPMPPKQGKPMLVVIVAILFALVLAGVGVAAYMNSKKQNNNSGTENVQGVTTEEVDKVSSDVEESVKAVDDAADFAEADLSDASLGL